MSVQSVGSCREQLSFVHFVDSISLLVELGGHRRHQNGAKVKTQPAELTVEMAKHTVHPQDHADGDPKSQSGSTTLELFRILISSNVHLVADFLRPRNPYLP